MFRKIINRPKDLHEFAATRGGWKKSVVIWLLLISSLYFTGCSQEDNVLIQDYKEELSNTKQKVDDATKCSPLYTGARQIHTEKTLVSRSNGYTAENIAFESSQILWAVFRANNDTTLIRSFQNLIRISDESGRQIKEMITTLVPTPEYAKDHLILNWNDLKFYDHQSDFTGYEIFSTPDDGMVFGAWYYENGKRQYGTILYDNDPHLRIKTAFLERILRSISFVQTEHKKTREYREYEEVIEIWEMDNQNIMHSVVIVFEHIEPTGRDQADSDDSSSDYLGGGRSDRYHTTDYLQRDAVKIEGSTFVKESIINSYYLDGSIYPYGGYGSSPCLAISLALLYYDKFISVDTIWSTLDSPDYFYNIFDDYIAAGDLEYLISKYFRYHKVPAGSICSNIKNKRLCITVSKTGDSQCIYKCMLIVGYTQENTLIYLDPVTGEIKHRSNDCLDEFTFVIDKML